MAKTVFVLGAGFSKDAGFPLQSGILSLITDSEFVGLSDISSEPKPDSPTTRFLRERKELIEFLGRVFHPQEQRLEDIFTLLDQSISTRATFAGYKLTDLIRLRDAWVRSILFCLHKRSEEHLAKPASMYVRFAEWLIGERVTAGLEGDPISVVSLNWDSLLEDSLYRVIHRLRALRRVDVDYCVYTTPLDPNPAICPHTPSPKQRASGIFNLKLLKLHGSATWLRCPNSGLVYTGLGMTTPASQLYVVERRSPFMERYRSGPGAVVTSILEPYIITPTYSKVFDLPHIQTTWQNAFVELREAHKVIFVGYSLPDADYHLRTLLIRAIRPNAKIRVVLAGADDPDEYDLDLAGVALPDGLRTRLSRVPEMLLPEARYRRLFGNTVTFDYNGVESLIENLVSAKGVVDYKSIRKQLNLSRADDRRVPQNKRVDRGRMVFFKPSLLPKKG